MRKNFEIFAGAIAAPAARVRARRGNSAIPFSGKTAWTVNAVGLSLPQAMNLPNPKSFFARPAQRGRLKGRVYFANFAAMALGTVFIMGSTIFGASAASGLRLMCSGNLTNTQANGDTLGQCDLNFISVKEMTEIEDVCGIPGTVDTPAENKCRIRAIVSPEPSPAANRKLYRVFDVLTVDKR